MSGLEFSDLTVRYGHGASAHTAVDGFQLTVRPGTSHGLVGESGSGKSTVAAAAVGLVLPSAGSITLDGADIVGRSAAARRARRRVQLVFQDPYSALDPRMPIGSSIAEGTRATQRKWSRPEQRDRVAELLERVHIDPERAGELPSAFSGGQRQRITIARALAAEPSVLIADEITSALDVSVQGVVLNLLRELQRELELTVLFISHNLAVVNYMCDSVSVMQGGKVVEAGPTSTVLAAPEDAYTRELLASVPVMGRRMTWDDEQPGA
ncbi:MAG TPA: ATP-binding cassette domain-containing protein [Plantibacter sp.]|uniref:ABC transporter ATP-binding protein n=1 Tax=unclassified Plantibacter TaxID=2624265 RepID=UPI002B6BDAE5|nr:ATP-binding cassette domain-containing protein [Plantibacter sp.]